MSGQSATAAAGVRSEIVGMRKKKKKEKEEEKGIRIFEP